MNDITVQTRRYSVPEVSCNHCRVAITEEVSGVEGVTAVDVDVDEKTVTVAGGVDDAKAIAAIRAAGYSAEVA